MFKVERQEDAKHLFEQSNDYLVTTRTPRSIGFPYTSNQLILEDVKFDVPIAIKDQCGDGETCINDLRRLTDMSQYPIGPHIIFNSGEFHSLLIEGYKTKNLSDEGATHYDEHHIFAEYNLNIEIRGGTFKGPIRLKNSRVGNVTIRGGVFEAPVVFERGVYGAIRLLGGEFKRGIFFGRVDLFPAQRVFMHPPSGAPAWRSVRNGIFGSIEINLDGDTSVDLNNLCIKNDFIVDVKKATVAISGMECCQTAKFLNGVIQDHAGRYAVMQVGSSSMQSRLSFATSDTAINDLVFSGLLSKDSSVSGVLIKLNSLCFRGFVNLSGIVWDRLSFLDEVTKITLSENADAQAFNKDEYSIAAARDSLGGGNYLGEAYKIFDAALKTPNKHSTEIKYALLEIMNSDLGKMTFIQCQLTARVSFESSKLNEISLVGSEFPTDSWSDEIPHSQRRLALHQLKKVYDSSGDSQRARKLKAAELEEYRLELNDSDANDEKITLRLNQISNRHGESWTEALKMLALGGSLFWLATCLPLFRFQIEPSENFSIFMQSIPYMIEFCNPVHKLGFVETYAKSVGGYGDRDLLPIYAIAFGNTLDSIWRIFSAYLIYQGIAAFRKHGQR